MILHINTYRQVLVFDMRHVRPSTSHTIQYIYIYICIWNFDILVLYKICYIIYIISFILYFVYISIIIIILLLIYIYMYTHAFLVGNSCSKTVLGCQNVNISASCVAVPGIAFQWSTCRCRRCHLAEQWTGLYPLVICCIRNILEIWWT